VKRVRVRISTFMLLIVIAALCAALVVQQRRAAFREAELRDELDSRSFRNYLKQLYAAPPQRKTK
jgi:hypothetical protein